MSSVLDKVWVECLMPREYEYLHHGVTQLGPQSKFKLKSLQVIIASLRVAPGVPLVPGHEQAHVQTTRQTYNEQSQHSFIYYGYSFLVWGASLNEHYGYAVNFHHEWCMA